MRRIACYSFGIYYKHRSPHVHGVSNVHPMRDLVYLVKNNRDRQSPATLPHPSTPDAGAVRVESPKRACAYVAAALIACWSRVQQALQLGGAQIALVPVPSSEVDESSIETARWPGRELARELERRGCGTTCLCVVNSAGHQPKHSSGRVAAPDLAQRLRLIATPPTGATVVYVDDLITWGDHLAAIDRFMGEPGDLGRALSVGVTADRGRAITDCLQAQTRTIAYQPSSPDWRVAIR